MPPRLPDQHQHQHQHQHAMIQQRPSPPLRGGLAGRILAGALMAMLAIHGPQGGAGPARAASAEGDVWAESIVDQPSALRDAKAKVPAGARVLSSRCREVALPGLSFRYRCSVRFERAPAQPTAPPASLVPAPTGAAAP